MDFSDRSCDILIAKPNRPRISGYGEKHDANATFDDGSCRYFHHEDRPVTGGERRYDVLEAEDAGIPTAKVEPSAERRPQDRLMIQRGSLLTQLFALITLMKHLISPRVLQAAGVWPISAPSLTRISRRTPPSIPSHPPRFTRSSSPSACGRDTTNPCPLAFIHLSVIIFLFSHPPAVPANNRTSFRPVYTCTLVAASFILLRRARTITVIYCITGARVYGPLIAARVSAKV